MLVPAKHRRDGFGELDMVGFVNAAGAYPDVFQAILPSLVDTESEFFASSILLPRILLHY